MSLLNGEVHKVSFPPFQLFTMTTDVGLTWHMLIGPIMDFEREGKEEKDRVSFFGRGGGKSIHNLVQMWRQAT